MLAVSAIWNIAGQAAPILTAVWTVPALIARIGLERFGFLSFGWLLVGYFSLFDFGLARALTHALAKAHGAHADNQSALISTGLVLMLLLGITGGGTLAAASAFLVGRVVHVSPALRPEAIASLKLIALTVPLTLLTVGLKGILQAYGRFDLLNMVAVPLGVLNYVLPLAFATATVDLKWIISALFLNRLLACAAYAWTCWHSVPHVLLYATAWDRPSAKQLFSIGAWITIGNVLSPITIYLDRLIIASSSPLAQLTYYSTPYEIVSRLLILSGAVAAVMFPAFSASFGRDKSITNQQYAVSAKYSVLVLYPCILFIVCFSKELLTWWLGSDFAGHSYRVAQLLAVGVFALGVEGIPFALLQGIGRPDLVVKMILLELPFYVPLMIYAATAHGVLGAAVVWSARAIVDAALLSTWAARSLGRRLLTPHLLALLLFATAGLAGAILEPGLGAKLLSFLCGSGSVVGFLYFVCLCPGERPRFRSVLTEAGAERGIAL